MKHHTLSVILVLSVYILSFAGVGVSELICPQNTAVLAGDTVHLQFESNGSFYFVNWLEYTKLVNGKTIFLNGTNIYSDDEEKASRFNLTLTLLDANTTHVMHTMSVHDVTLADAGRYCALEFITSTFHWAELVVLASPLECMWVNSDPSISDRNLIPGDIINVTCSIPYQGKWAPVFRCTGSNFNNIISVNQTSHEVARYDFEAQVEDRVAVSDVTCEAMFENPKPDEYMPGHAENIPDYTSLWQSESISVFYPANAIAISPVKADYDAGDVISCEASGSNPAPTYQWFVYNSTDLLATSPFLTVTADMAGTSFNATCIATTTIRDVDNDISHTVELTVNVPPTPPPTPAPTTNAPQESTTKADGGGSEALDNAMLIIIIVSVIAGLLFIVLMVVLIVCCMKKISKENTEHI